MAKTLPPPAPPRFFQKRAWTPEEDSRLLELIRQHGAEKWSLLASRMGGRAGKQCRERWHNHLCPKLSKRDWSATEEWLLFLLHQRHGNKWAEISKKLRGRSDNCVKNHWNSIMRKRLSGMWERLGAALSLKKENESKFKRKYTAEERSILCELGQMEGLSSQKAQTPASQSKSPRTSASVSLATFETKEKLEEFISAVEANQLSLPQMETVLAFVKTNLRVILPGNNEEELKFLFHEKKKEAEKVEAISEMVLEEKAEKKIEKVESIPCFVRLKSDSITNSSVDYTSYQQKLEEQRSLKHKPSFEKFYFQPICHTPPKTTSESNCVTEVSMAAEQLGQEKFGPVSSPQL